MFAGIVSGHHGVKRLGELVIFEDVYKRQALNRKLIELAVNDVTLRFADGSRSFTPDELSAILETLRCV